MTYTFRPDICEGMYNPKIKKQLRDFEKKLINNKGSNIKFIYSETPIFKVEKIKRKELEMEQPPLDL